MKKKLSPVVMIPALNCDGRLFQHQIDTLQARGYEVIVIDNSKHFTNRELAEYVLSITPPKFHLIGLSMGGYAAFEIMKQQPDRVEQLILLDTTARPDSAEKREKRIKRRAEVEKGNLAAVTEKLWESMVAKNRVGDRELFDIYSAMSQSVGQQGFINQMNQVLNRGDDGFIGILPSIKCPTLVIVGEDDQRSPISIAQEIVNGINSAYGGKARLEVIRDAGHFSSLEQPEAVSNVIATFLCRDLMREGRTDQAPGWEV